jgi:hypothetical protein
LGGLRVVLLAKGEDVVIEELDKPFESDELDNSVWDLTRPERDETLVEAWCSFFSFKFSVGTSQRVRVFESRSWKLNFKLQGFPWAKKSISDDFSRSWCNRPADFFIFVSIFLANDSLVDILEDLIESELS